MQCPYCGGDSSVTETRDSQDGLRRRRVCNACRRRFTTYERVGQPGLRVEKRGGREAEPFDKDKLVKALARVCRRRVADEVVRRVARDIEAELVDSSRRSIAWHEIARAALRRLEAIDVVSARRLAANYLTESGDLRLGDEREGEGDLAQLGLPGVGGE